MPARPCGNPGGPSAAGSDALADVGVRSAGAATGRWARDGAGESGAGSDRRRPAPPAGAAPVATHRRRVGRPPDARRGPRRWPPIGPMPTRSRPAPPRPPPRCSPTSTPPPAAGRHGVVEPVLDHLEGQVVVLLLAQDPAQPIDVGLVELAVAGRGALRVEQPLALEEPDLRDGDVGELPLEQREDLADRQVGAVRRSTGHGASPLPVRNTSLNVPICSSSPSDSGADSTRSRLR